MDDRPKETRGWCPRCYKPQRTYSDGTIWPHDRLRRHRWLHCPGSGKMLAFMLSALRQRDLLPAPVWSDGVPATHADLD